MLELTAESRRIEGAVGLPSSKSISNRLLILRHLYQGELEIRNLSEAEDTTVLDNALREIASGRQHTIDVKDAGTDMRFLTALLSVTKGTWTLTGSHRLQQRPVADLVDALRQAGAAIQYTGNEGYPPLLIEGKELRGGSLQIRSDKSSQFVSALLLIAPFLQGGLSIETTGSSVSTPYIKMTVALLRDLGVKIGESQNIYHVHHLGSFPGRSFDVEADWSAASYFYSICALSPGCSILLRGLSLNSLQGDSVLADIYSQLGVNTAADSEGIMLSHQPCDKGVFICDFSSCPDIAQTVAVTCFALGRETMMNGLRTLRIKETDRIAALENELQKAGAKVKSTSESLHILPAEIKEKVLKIKTYGDHRMAMSFAPLALKTKKIIIEDPSVVVKSYPSFWDDLRSLGFNVNLQPR